MLLRDWLLGLGARSVERAWLKDINYFEFSDDRYIVKMHDGREFQDNDLERILSVIRDEFYQHNVTAILKGGERMHPSVEYPFVKGKPHMLVRPVVWTAVIPPPDIDPMIEQLEQAITLFNLTGSFQPPMAKDNL